MSVRNRERRLRNAEGKSRRETVTWQDVREHIAVQVEDVDHIINPAIWAGGEDDDGAPASIYADPALLRRWLTTHHPAFVCDGPECRQLHPHVIQREEYRCKGQTYLINAGNRTLAEVQHRLSALDSRRRWTPAEVLEHLRREGENE